MKVICDRAALKNAVDLVAGVVPARSPKPELTCIKVAAKKASGKGGAGAGALTLSATDAEVSLRLSRTQVEVQDGGEILVPGDRLRSIVTAEDADPTLTIEADSEACVIKGRDAKFKIYGYPSGSLPPIPEFPDNDQTADIFSINAGQLQRLITRTIFAVARDNSRYAINGVLLKRNGKKIEMVATDGRRLALARGTAEGSPSGDKQTMCIVPTKALTLASRLIDDEEAAVRIGVTANQVIFSFDAEGGAGGSGGGGTILASNLVEGTFPPYEDVIPKDQDKRAKFDVNALSSAVRRAAILTNEESRGVRMAFAGGGKGMKMSSRTPESGEAEIDVEVESYDGGEIEIGFNPAFLSDALKVVPEQHVLFEMKAGNKPGLMKSGNDFLYVVMPVNLQ